MFGLEADSSIAEAYINAFGAARHYIYLEDQYFTPNFGSPAFGTVGADDGTSPMAALKEALKRGVELFVVLPGTGPKGPGIRPMRDDAIEGLRRFARQMRAPSPLFVELRSASVSIARRRRVGVHVHSKLLLCDDEYGIVGSQNVNARSFRNDVELAVSVRGAQVKLWRDQLWSEHVPAARGHDWNLAMEVIKSQVAAGEGGLVTYKTKPAVYPLGVIRRAAARATEALRD